MSAQTDPLVTAFVDALNAGDKDGVLALLAEDVTMSDDGTDRDPAAWLDAEAFSVSGHMDVESTADDGLSLIATYRNSRWGVMSTRWKFLVADGKITRFETGQA